TRPRVAENLGTQLPVSVSGCVAPNRAAGYAGVSAELEFAVEQVLHATLIHDQHDQINRLAANLEPEAAALNREERRIAPSFGGTATGDPSAIARAEDEPSFQHGRNHRDTLGRSHHFVRNAGIRGSLNLFQNCG